jgi:UDP-N-acetylmuramate dehydrogenase
MQKIQNQIAFQKNKSLKDLTTIGIGGDAHYFIEVRTVEEMRLVLQECLSNSLKYMVLGKGSNVIFDDRGYCGVIIQNKISFCEQLADGLFHVGAGYSFSLLGAQTARKGWAGLEFASGIPGSVGGAVFMNAGANGSETCDVLVSVDYVDEGGLFHHLVKSDLEFSYRTSSFQKMRGAIVGATFQLSPSKEARQRQLTIINYRKETQPYSDMSAGCIFRNPSSLSAGALIERSQLKGMRVGDAQVSDLHANFIINKSDATSRDVLELIRQIQCQVREKMGVELEPEVRYIPYEGSE